MPRWGLVTYCSVFPSELVLFQLSVCAICQSLLKGKFRGLNGQKLKLAESKVKSPLTQRTLGAAVQDVTDAQAQPWPSGATARVPVKAPFWNSSALMAYMSRKLTWQTKWYMGCTLTEVLSQAVIAEMGTERILCFLEAVCGYSHLYEKMCFPWKLAFLPVKSMGSQGIFICV